MARRKTHPSSRPSPGVKKTKFVKTRSTKTKPPFKAEASDAPSSESTHSDSAPSLRSLPSIPSWLPRRTEPDPVLTSLIRRFLNGRSEVISYSDSTGILNVSVRNEYSAKLIRELKKELIQLVKDQRKEIVNVEKGYPFVACGPTRPS